MYIVSLGSCSMCIMFSLCRMSLMLRDSSRSCLSFSLFVAHCLSIMLRVLVRFSTLLFRISQCALRVMVSGHVPSRRAEQSLNSNTEYIGTLAGTRKYWDGSFAGTCCPRPSHKLHCYTIYNLLVAVTYTIFRSCGLRFHAGMPGPEGASECYA